MKDAQDLNVLQARADPVGDDMAGLGNNQLVSARQPTGVTQRWIITQQRDRLDNLLDDDLGGLGIVLGNMLRLIIQIFQCLTQPFNLHLRPTC